MKYNVQFTNQFKKDLKLASEPMGTGNDVPPKS